MTDVGDTNRARMVRTRAKRLGLTMVKRGPVLSLFDSAGLPVVTGDLDQVEHWVADRFHRRRSGPEPAAVPAPWRPWIEVFVDEQRAAKRSAGTIRTRVLCLSTFARAHPGSNPLAVTRDDLVRYLGGNDWSPRTAHSARSTFRVFFRLLRDLGHRADDPARTLPQIGIPRSMPRPCPDHAVQQAYSSASDYKVRLALRIAIETGLRRAEVARVRRSDVGGGSGRYSLHVVGKGGHERSVPISDDLASELLKVETIHVFPAYGGGPITAAHLGKLISRSLPGHWTTHTLRHRFATMAYDASRDLRAVQELLGHASPVTTAIYTRVSDDSMRRAAAAAALPG